MRVVSAYDCMGEVTPPSFLDLGRGGRPAAFTRNSQRPRHPRLGHLRLVFRLLRRHPRPRARCCVPLTKDISMEPRQARQAPPEGRPSGSSCSCPLAPVRQVLGPAGPGTRLARAVCFTLPRVRVGVCRPLRRGTNSRRRAGYKYSWSDNRARLLTRAPKA